MVVGSFVSMFSNRNVLLPDKKKDPMLNVAIATLRSNLSNVTQQRNKKKRFMNSYESSNAILTGLVNGVATDINEKVYFEPENPSESNRNRILKAEDFYDKNRVRQMFYAIIVDILATGEGYSWIGKLTKDKVQKSIDKYIQSKGMPVNNMTRQLVMKANFSDETDLTLRKIRYIASTTMENLYDRRKIEKYVQKVGVNQLEYDPEEIIHSVIYDINGRPNGFTPVNALFDQLLLDMFMWKNMKALSENSGQPDRMYSVEDIDINSPAFKRIEAELRKYHGVQNRHGSLLLNGKVSIQDLQQLDSMQFQDLGVYIASIAALQWRIPRSRLPFVMKGTNTSEDTGGNSEKGYYDNISYMQDIFATTFNQQLWQPFFKVKMKFRKSYKQDEVRETSTQVQRMDVLDKIQLQYAKDKKMLKPEFITRYFNRVCEEIQEEDLMVLPEPDPIELGGMPGVPGVPGQQPKKTDLSDNTSQANVRQRRSTEQNNAAAKRDKPTGTGKEIDSTEISVKEMLKKEIEQKEVVRVPFFTFVSLYNSDKSFNKEPPRVFMAENDGMTRMTYRSTDFVYETTTPTEQVSQIQLMNFRQIIKLPEADFLEVIDATEGEE